MRYPLPLSFCSQRASMNTRTLVKTTLIYTSERAPPAHRLRPGSEVCRPDATPDFRACERGGRVCLRAEPPSPSQSSEIALARVHADHPRSRLATIADRRLIEATTGEHITTGQQPSDRPVSSFAMQIAVDRERGRLGLGEPVTTTYLRTTAYRLDELGVPAHEFTGETLQRALDFLASGSGRHIDLAV